MTSYKPEGYHNVTALITADGANDLIAFLEDVFGTTVRFRMDAPGGKVGHAELMLGDSVIMVADPDERGLKTSASLHIYVEDCDAACSRAVAAGATLEDAPETHFYGDRSGCVSDRWGNRWYIATHVEDVSEEDMRTRMAEMATA